MWLVHKKFKQPQALFSITIKCIMDRLISRYAHIFKKEGFFFLYNARTNSFYELSEEAVSFLKNFADGKINCLDKDEAEFVESLIEKKIIVPKDEDDEYLEEEEVKYRIRAFGKDCLDLTLVPTISCNLKCPYCFETSKPDGKMSDSVIKRLVEFINQYPSRYYGITWFGGEPLLCMDQIETILTELQDCDKKLSYHRMITNGTLWNERAFNLFMKFPLDSVQITFDGGRSNHDKKRFFSNGNGTFDVILKNAKLLKTNFQNTRLSFRINVDKTTQNDYEELEMQILNDLGHENVNVYPGILISNGKCRDELLFSFEEEADFRNNLTNRENVFSTYPSKASKGCCATSVGSFVVGPKGELYCCWEHVGNEKMIIGSIIENEHNDTRLNNAFILHGNCFTDATCRSCGLLPVCTGGCPKKRVENKLYGANHTLCAFYKGKSGEVLNDILYKYYKNINQK